VLGELTDPAAVERVADDVLRDLGGIDIFVNCAGGRTSTSRSSWDAVVAEDWTTCYQLNVVAPAVVIERLLPGMRDRNWGRIILVSSAVAFRPLANNADYAASKAALSTMAVSLTQALIGSAITVNTVSPGATATPALLAAMRAQAQAKGEPDDLAALEAAASALWPCALQRLAQPGEIADTITFLTSPRAGFITGANVRVDGGRAGVAL
jgi:3-oxoacyl-[acyl-carrier protein] reductase